MSEPLFAMARFMVMSAAAEASSAHLPGAYVHAWVSSLYPLFHEGRLQEAFDAEFDISKQEMSDLMTRLDSQWLSGAAPTFYQLESQLSGDDVWDRVRLIDALRYAWLSSRFDNEFYLGLLKAREHPIEASRILEPFDREFDIPLP